MTFEETSLHRKWSDLYWIGYRATQTIRLRRTHVPGIKAIRLSEYVRKQADEWQPSVAQGRKR